MKIKLIGFNRKEWTDKKTGEQKIGFEIHGIEVDKPDTFVGEKTITPFFAYARQLPEKLVLGRIYSVDFYMWSSNGQTMCKPQGLTES